MKKNSLRRVNCDLCNNSSYWEVPGIKEFTSGQIFGICKNCGLVYAPYRRRFHDICDDWNNMYDNKKDLNTGYSTLNPWIIARLTGVSEFIKRSINIKGKCIVDIGSGEGTLLGMLKSGGADVIGMDPSDYNCRIMKKKGIKCHNVSIENCPPTLFNKADIVLMTWALECCEDPNRMMSFVDKILKADGRIVWAGGSRIMVPFKKPIGLFFSKNPVDTYPVRFSFGTLSAFLYKHGFEIVAKNRYVDTDVMVVVAKRRGKYIKKVKYIQGDGWTRMDVVDEPGDVRGWFTRWHNESKYYRWDDE